MTTQSGDKLFPRHRKSIAFLALVSSLAIVYVLFTRLQYAGGYGPVFDVWRGDEQEPFSLHPESHRLRDPAVIKHHWRISRGARRPDGVLKDVYLINDAFPGPTLECRSGDRLIIQVENLLEDQGIAMHWHGLSMRDANGMDGAAGVTQPPILPGMTFEYDFTIATDQSGTFWYHAHDGVQRADGLYGGLVVHSPISSADELVLRDEHLLLIGDWYHRSAQDALQFYMHPGAFGLETVPDSMLVNGRGAFECSRAVPARPVDCEVVGPSNLPILDLVSDKQVLLRVVNVGAYAGLRIGLSGTYIKPLSIDGDHGVAGVQSESVGYLHPGERVSLLVERRSYAEGQNLSIAFDESMFKYDNPALMAAQQFPVIWRGNASIMGSVDAVSGGMSDIQTLTSEQDQSLLLPETADEMIVLYAVTQKLARLDNEPHGFINHSTWKPPPQPLNSLSRSEWDENQLVLGITLDEASPHWIDIVLNNLDEEGHPFHLHGHDFWVLSTYSSSLNWGSYNPFDEDATHTPPGGSYDLVGARKKDTIYVPRRGYAVLRFRADNPGLWMFHCHVLWHFASGMSMAFDVR